MTTPSEWNVADWLTSFGMKEFIPKFLEHGYETEKLCSNLLTEDMEAMCIDNKLHLEVIFAQSEILRKKLEASAAVIGNGPSQAFLSTPSEDTDGRTSPRNLTKHHKGRRSPVGIQQRTAPVTAASVAVDKIHHHAPPPESHRTFAGLTKLQLKLRIKEEIRKEHIVLSEAPYCRADGSANEELLQQLAEEFSERFNLESLTVYYALKDVWRFMANEKTEIATPKSGELKKVRKPTEILPELSTYSEPFDNKLQSPGIKPPKKVAVSGSVSPKTPLTSFQAIPEAPGTYADPFDALPLNSKDGFPSAELNKRKPVIASPKSANISPRKYHDDSNIKWKVSPGPLNKTHSFTLPPPGSPSISSSSSEDSPKKSPRSHRFWSPFRKRKNASSSTSQSPQHLSSDKPRSVVHGSMENIPKGKSPARMQQSASQNRLSRQSLPGALAGLPHITTDSGLLCDSGSDDSPTPAKRLSGSCGILIDSGHDTPPIAGDGSSPSGSLGDEKERVVSRIKSLAIKRSNSDFELSNIVELYVEGQDKPFRFKKAQSTEELDKDDGSIVDRLGKKKKTSNILSRLFKPKSRKERLKVTGKKSKCQSVSDDLIVPSRSMPTVSRAVAAVIHSEYTEVFDDDVRGRATKTPSPTPSPRVPQRNRPHTTKPHRTTSSRSPRTSPPTHHRLMVKSDSIGSSEMTIHSIPASKEDNDLTIELSVPVAIPTASCDSQTGLEEGEDCGEVFPSSDAERSPERDSNITQIRIDDSCIASHTEENLKPVVITKARTPSGSKPPLAPKPVISRERLTSGGSQKRMSRNSLECSPSPSHSFLSPEDSPSKPPPKPSRGKARSMKSMSPPVSIEVRSGEESHESNIGHHLLPAEMGERATLSTGEGAVLVVEHPAQKRWSSGGSASTLPPPKPPKPFSSKGSSSLPQHLKTEISPALLDSIKKKLTEEDIDLSRTPYTNQLGEYSVPSALVSRYIEEMDRPAIDITASLEEIRRRSLSKIGRKYVPLVGNWKNHSSLDGSSVKAFLTSLGLPMYSAILEEYGYSSVELLQSASPEQMYILPLTDKHRQLLSTGLSSL